jgi:hypothetical protein
MCCGVANLGNVGSGGSCYGCHSRGGVAEAEAVSAVAQTGAIAVPTVSKTCKTSLFLLLFSKGADGQDKDDTNLGKRKESQSSMMLICRGQVIYPYKSLKTADLVENCPATPIS